MSAGGRPPVSRGGANSLRMRIINLIVIHCTATLEGRPFDVAAIRAMHKAKGWSDIGYHKLIGIYGEIWDGRPEGQIGAHVQGHNANSLGVCYVGGIGTDGRATDTRTTPQIDALYHVLTHLQARYPNACIRGHRDMSPDLNHDGKIGPNEWLKACPCFDAVEWCKSVGIDPK